MSSEVETVALASAGALADANGDLGDSTCRNCGAQMTGKYCVVCGQLGSNFHRPIWSLVTAVLADSFSLDGRIARTLPALMLNPGKATRHYLDGKRARYVPPFRLFLLAGVLFFAVIFALGDQLGWTKSFYIIPNEQGGFQFKSGEFEDIGVDRPAFIRSDGTIDREALKERLLSSEHESPPAEQELDDIVNRIVNTYENQGEFFNEIEKWAPRLSLLIFPLLTLTLTLLFAWRRSIYVYDHLITALHFQSWLYLVSVLVLLACYFITPYAGFILLIAPQIYLYRMLRSVYGSGRIMAFLRMCFIWLVSFVALTSLMAVLLLIGVFAASGAMPWAA